MRSTSRVVEKSKILASFGSPPSVVGLSLKNSSVSLHETAADGIRSGGRHHPRRPLRGPSCRPSPRGGGIFLPQAVDMERSFSRDSVSIAYSTVFGPPCREIAICHFPHAGRTGIWYTTPQPFRRAGCFCEFRQAMCGLAREWRGREVFNDIKRRKNK